MKKKQIMIVEDERVSAKDIKMGSQRFGYSVSGMAVFGEEVKKNTAGTNTI